MTTKELFSEIKSLESDLIQNSYLFNAIRVMSNHQVEIIKLHSSGLLAGDLHSTNNAVNEVKNRLNQIIEEVRKLSPKKIFSEINAIGASLSRLESSFDSNASKKFQVLKHEIEAFSEAYESLVTTYQLGQIARLLSVAQRVDAAFSSSIEFTSVILKNLCPDFESGKEDGRQLEIFLPSETDLVLFLEKISALEKIYDELCQLFGISTKQEPLKIVKIESGCAWAWLMGHPGVISAMRSAIEKTAHFIYRNYSTEGKLASIPKNVETIESVLHLHDELKSRGIDTEKLDEHISKASVKLGNSLQVLLGGEDQIELNGEVIPLSPKAQEKLISGRKVLLIEEKNTQ